MESFLECDSSLLLEGWVVAAASSISSLRIFEVRLVLSKGAAAGLIRCLRHVALILDLITINLGQLFLLRFFLLLKLKLFRAIAIVT